MPRLKKGMTPQEAIVALAGGNSGAVYAGAALYKESTQRAPSAAGAGILRDADALELYGVRLHCLFAIMCHGNAATAISMINACMLGVVPKKKLWAALHACASSRPHDIDVEASVKLVNARLAMIDRTKPGQA